MVKPMNIEGKLGLELFQGCKPLLAQEFFFEVSEEVFSNCIIEAVALS